MNTKRATGNRMVMTRRLKILGASEKSLVCETCIESGIDIPVRYVSTIQSEAGMTMIIVASRRSNEALQLYSLDLDMGRWMSGRDTVSWAEYLLWSKQTKSLAH